MSVKTTLAFLVAVGVSLPAAVHRFRDSGHAVGRLSASGGSARHAVQLDPGKRQYAVAVSGIVMPPYRGDARVAVDPWGRAGRGDLGHDLLLREALV